MFAPEDLRKSSMIWDLHCHLSGVDGTTPEERMAQLIKYADRMGIDRLVVFMGFPWSLVPDPDEFRRQNDQVLQAIGHWHDRAFGFVYLNPAYPEESLAELERCIAEGPMTGLKLWVARRCGDEQIDPIIARATELNAVIYQHTWYKVTGNLDGESTPEDLVRLARRHPQARLICGHTGGDWELGIRAVRDVENISIGIGGSDPTAGFVEMAVRELGPQRVIYGSDMGGRSIASQLAKVTAAGIGDLEKRMILGENLRRLMGPILETKGIEL